MLSNDPVISIATAPGRGAVGVVRVSGASLQLFVEALLGKRLKPRLASLCTIADAQAAQIDEGLALYFPAPHSYTGEDVLELQVHGGSVVLQLVVQRCLEVATTINMPLRLAHAGEFTERAFLNDKLDLAQAEAVADLIDASTEAAVRSASRSLSGAFSAEVHVLRDALIHLRMLVEATLDFPEEEIDFLKKADALGQLENLRTQLQEVQSKTKQGALLREGVKLVIAGQPNAGKSSLLNALAGAQLAIVTPIAGTTRDVVQQTLQIEGVPIHVLDTAGLRDEHTDEVERIGIERAWAHILDADVIVFLHDLSKQDDAPHTAQDKALRDAMTERSKHGRTVIDVWNKADLVTLSEGRANNWGQIPIGSQGSEKQLGSDPNWLADSTPITLSTKTSLGLDTLRRKILEVVGWKQQTEGLFIARERHVQALAQVATHLGAARQHLNYQAPTLDILAEELRLAQNALGAITGEFTADDLLGEIFGKFCIGK